MGSLISLSEAHSKASWYFKEAYYTNGNWYCDIEKESECWPYKIGIHQDDLERSHKIEIRKWVQESIPDTVIHATLDLSYQHQYGDRWDQCYEISNYWTVFFFESESSALLFKMQFANLIQEITNHHPKRDHVIKEHSHHRRLY